MYNAKNYTEQGGEKTVIGGVLEIQDGAEVTGLPSSGGAEKSEFPDTFQGSMCEELPTDTDAPAAQIATAVNTIRLALIANGMMEGLTQTTFGFHGICETTNDVLKANAQACTAAFDKASMTLTLKCNPDALAPVTIPAAPYNGYDPHKYVIVEFYAGNYNAADFGNNMQVDNGRYYPGAWTAVGLSTGAFYVPIAVDLLKPGLNRKACFMQHGAYERTYVNINLETTA